MSSIHEAAHYGQVLGGEIDSLNPRLGVARVVPVIEVGGRSVVESFGSDIANRE